MSDPILFKPSDFAGTDFSKIPAETIDGITDALAVLPEEEFDKIIADLRTVQAEGEAKQRRVRLIAFILRTLASLGGVVLPGGD